MYIARENEGEREKKEEEGKKRQKKREEKEEKEEREETVTRRCVNLWTRYTGVFGSFLRVGDEGVLSVSPSEKEYTFHVSTQ